MPQCCGAPKQLRSPIAWRRAGECSWWAKCVKPCRRTPGWIYASGCSSLWWPPQEKKQRQNKEKFRSKISEIELDIHQGPTREEKRETGRKQRLLWWLQLNTTFHISTDILGVWGCGGMAAGNGLINHQFSEQRVLKMV